MLACTLVKHNILLINSIDCYTFVFLFLDGLSQFLYFYLPMAILVSINFVLFIITAHTIRTTIRDNQKMLRSKESQRHSESNKQDYVLYVKLFGAMGINWTMEFISFTVDWCLGHDKVTWIWYPTDFCNAIYGIFIFVLFVCKKAVWIKLKQRYNLIIHLLIFHFYSFRNISG